MAPNPMQFAITSPTEDVKLVKKVTDIAILMCDQNTHFMKLPKMFFYKSAFHLYPDKKKLN